MEVRVERTVMPVCIGRFQFEIEGPMALSGRMQSIYRVQARSVRLGVADTPSTVWSRRLDEIRRLAGPASKDPVVRVFDLPPDARAVLYHARSSDDSYVTLEAHRAFGGHVLQLDSELSSDSAGSADRVFSNIFKAYVPGGRVGFCLDDGAITSEPSKYESTSASFTNGKPDASKILYTSDTVGKPDTADPLTFAGEEKALLEEKGLHIEILLNEYRTVARLRGVESRISMLAPGDPRPSVRYTWRFPGIPGDIGSPQIMIVGTGPIVDQAQLRTAWDKVLQSLHFVGKVNPQ